MSNASHAGSSLGVSPTLANNELALQLRSEGKRVLDMGFGEAPFPAPPRLVSALRDNAHERSYQPVAGIRELTDVIAAHHQLHTDTDMDAYDVVVGPGSKTLLFAIQMAVPGDILLPTPSWVSYFPQAKLLGQQVIPVATQSTSDGLTIETAAIEEAAKNARASSLNPTKLLINFPSNPTGLTISDDSLDSIVDVCRRLDLTLISDEIYGRLSYDHLYRSASSRFPEGTIVSTGLSKHLSVGGWRFGVCLLPKQQRGLYDRYCSIASELWSCVSTPIQLAAIEAYRGHDDVETFIADTTDIHAFVNRQFASQMTQYGIDCPTPQGGFYTWPDFGQILAGTGMTSNHLTQSLRDQFNLLTLPGTVFGENENVLRLRLSGCDYDGARALDIWRAGREHDTGFFNELAPNIAKALQCFESFVQE